MIFVRFATGLLAGLALALAGCSPNMVEVAKSMNESDRSWCFSWAGSPPYSGPVYIGATGIDGGMVTCGAQGLNQNMGMGMSGGGPILVPRILVPTAPTYEELDTSPGAIQRRAPVVRRPAPK